MGRVILIITCVLSFISTYGQNTFFTLIDEAYAGVTPALGGGYYVIGETKRQEPFTYKLHYLDDNGDKVWTRSYGSINYQSTERQISIYQLPDSTIWIGQYDSIFKLSRVGDILVRAKSPATSSSTSTLMGSGCIKVYHQNNKVYFVWTSGDVSVHDATTGSLIWLYKRRDTGRDDRFIKDLHVDGSSIYACGDSNGTNGIYSATYGKVLKIEPTGNIVGNGIFNPPYNNGTTSSNHAILAAIKLHSNGYLYTAGFIQVGPAQRNVYVMKIDTNLNLIWDKNVHFANQVLGQTTVRTIIETADGNMIAAGQQANGSLGLLVKFDVDGNKLWARTLPYCTNIRDITETADGGLLLAANFYIASQSRYNSAVIKLDAFGNIRHALIKGNVFVDLDSDTIRDANEPGVPSRLVMSTSQPYYALTNTNGDYEIMLLDTGSMAFKLSIPTHFSPNYPNSDSITVQVPQLDSVYAGNNFALTKVGQVEDIEISFSPGGARSSSLQSVFVTVRNIGNVTAIQPLVKLKYDPLLATPFSSSSVYTTVGDTLVWQLPNIPIFKSTSFQVNFDLVNDTSGSILKYVAIVNTPASDSTPSNNIDSTAQTMRNSYDPNNKLSFNAAESLQGYFTELDSKMEYVINFQNTGNDSAYSVLLIDTLDLSVLDIKSLDIISASHSYQVTLSNEGILKFLFADIYLPDSATNPITSQGFVRFSMDVNGGLPNNTLILNQAGIYFDANTVVKTNFTSNTFVLCDSTNKYTLSDYSACSGDTVLATYTGIGASDLLWNIAGNITVNEPMLNYIADTLTYIPFALQTKLGACVKTVTDSLQTTQANPISIFWQNRKLCEGDTAMLVSTEPGSQWYSGSQALASGNSVVIDESGNYFATANSNGCLSVSNTISVDFDPVPAQPSISFANNELIASVVADKYVWYFNGTVLPDSTQSIAPTNDGEYTVVAISADCQSSISNDFRYQTIGISTNFNGSIKLYPNPTSGVFTLETTAGVGKTNIEVYNMIGETILIEQLTGYKIVFNLEKYPAGLYVVTLVNSQGRSHLLLTKQ